MEGIREEGIGGLGRRASWVSSATKGCSVARVVS